MQLAMDPGHFKHEPREPGKYGAMLLTVLVHGFLLGVLFFGVQWQRREPEPVMVDLVQPADLVAPRVEAPPRAPRPEPVPTPKPVIEPPKPQVQADIRIKEPPPKKPLPAPKPEVKPEPKPLPKVEPKPEKPAPSMEDRLQELLKSDPPADTAQARRDELLRRETGRVGTPSPTANPADVESWRAMIRAKVRGNMDQFVAAGLSGRPRADFEIELAVTGDVLGTPRLVKSSGNAALDAALERAITRSSPLPLPAKKEVFQRKLIMQFDPLGER